MDLARGAYSSVYVLISAGFAPSEDKLRISVFLWATGFLSRRQREHGRPRLGASALHGKVGATGSSERSLHLLR